MIKFASSGVFISYSYFSFKYEKFWCQSHWWPQKPSYFEISAQKAPLDKFLTRNNRNAVINLLNIRLCWENRTCSLCLLYVKSESFNGILTLSHLYKTEKSMSYYQKITFDYHVVFPRPYHPVLDKLKRSDPHACRVMVEI